MKNKLMGEELFQVDGFEYSLVRLRTFAAWRSEDRFYDGFDRKVDASTLTPASLLRP